MDHLAGLYVFAFFVELGSFFIKGIAGFGDPLISSPLLALATDNKTISPLNLCLGIPANGWFTWKNRRAFSIRQSLPAAACLLAGIIPGTLILKYTAPWILKMILGLLVLGLAVEMITRRRAKTPSKPPNKALMYFVAFISGVTAGMYGISLLFVAFVERTTDSRSAFRGNICFLFLSENLFRFVVYLVTGLFTRQVVTLVLVCLPAMALGLFIGSRVDKRLSDKTVSALVIAMFLLGGASIFINAVVFKS